MPQNETIRDAILDAAQTRARTAGYSGFSFRDIATDVGIKSASVHYHFPTKADLAYALMERYRGAALEMLGTATDLRTALHRLVDLFRAAAHDGEMCLCGALGAVPASLPPEVRQSAQRFSEALVDYLKAVPDPAGALPMEPEAVVALLEGALLLSITAGSTATFERAVAPLSRA